MSGAVWAFAPSGAGRSSAVSPSGGVSSFGFFWRDLLHPLLFDNRDWLTNPQDMTWYITPGSFFRNSMLVSLAVSATLVSALLVLSAWRAKHQ